jgi:hypothetical protein
VFGFDDQEINQVAKSPQEFVPEGNWAGTDWQTRGAMETGSFPADSNADSSIAEIERDKYREGGDIGP